MSGACSAKARQPIDYCACMQFVGVASGFFWFAKGVAVDFTGIALQSPKCFASTEFEILTERPPLA
jgi:hypothetical protein